MKIVEKIFDIVSNEETIIERDMTEAELKEYNNSIQRAEAEAQAKAEVEAARAALLSKLGITEEEARLLLGGN